MLIMICIRFKYSVDLNQSNQIQVIRIQFRIHLYDGVIYCN